MSTYLYFDGQLLPGSEPLTLPLASALLYGKGAFTTAAVNDGRPVLWAKHWTRLAMSADRLGIDISGLSEEATVNAIQNLVQVNEVVQGRARLTLYDLGSSSLWPVNSDRNAAMLITAAGSGTHGPIRLTSSPYTVNSRSPIAGIKTCNYVENLMAIDEAKNRGSDEAVRLNERGEIAGGCMANIFWSKDGRLFTPSLLTGCLSGTTREYVLENLECREVELSIEELKQADAIFLTSAGLGIVQAAEFNGKPLEKSDHPIIGLWPPA